MGFKFLFKDIHRFRQPDVDANKPLENAVEYKCNSWENPMDCLQKAPRKSCITHIGQHSTTICKLLVALMWILSWGVRLSVIKNRQLSSLVALKVAIMTTYGAISGLLPGNSLVEVNSTNGDFCIMSQSGLHYVTMYGRDKGNVLSRHGSSLAFLAKHHNLYLWNEFCVLLFIIISYCNHNKTIIGQTT